MRWNYIHIDSRDEMIMSGWKLYISGNTVYQGKLLALLLGNILIKYNLTAKIVTEDVIRRNLGKNISWSSMVIYLTNDVIGQLDELLRDINYSLRDYYHSGEVKGAHMLNDKVYLRYDLSMAINPNIGVNYETYLSLYRGEDGPYNILNNSSINLLL